MNLDSLEKLFIHELKDLYSAETQLIEALPRVAEAASDPGLRTALQNHLRETHGHVDRLEAIFANRSYSPKGHHCKGMEGLITEAQSGLTDVPEGAHETRDALIIAGGQRIEHYEIAGYGTARAYAMTLGDMQAVDLLTKTLGEEDNADKMLSSLAEQRINIAAAS
jgi:ferritin-like metal-binding protein YciE